jgi:hypothetical protein
MAVVGKKSRRVLFWINGSKPTADELGEAERIDGQVMFRNAQHVPLEGAMEPFDVLAGPAIPERYQREFDARQASTVSTMATNVVEIKSKPNAEAGSNIAEAPKKGSKPAVDWGAPVPKKT